jgi:hypothetical protein
MPITNTGRVLWWHQTSHFNKKTIKVDLGTIKVLVEARASRVGFIHPDDREICSGPSWWYHTDTACKHVTRSRGCWCPQQHMFVRVSSWKDDIRFNIDPNEDLRWVFICGVSVTPKVSLVLSELTMSVERWKSEFKLSLRLCGERCLKVNNIKSKDNWSILSSCKWEVRCREIQFIMTLIVPME